MWHYYRVIGFEDACVDSPAGVALLAALEARERPDVAWFKSPADSSPAAVESAVRAVGSMSFGEFCSVAVNTAESLVGPWVPDAAAAAAAAYRCADARRPIAAAIAERFDTELHAPMNPDTQQWWTSAPREDRANDPRRLFQDYDDVYGNGEFTWAGLWTVTGPPPEVHDALVSVWDIFRGPISRWRLPVDGEARVYELHRPQDWLALVAAHPVEAKRPHGGWELPGPNQSIKRSGLLELPNQKAAVGRLSGHVLPDWSQVAESFDAVHLSWAGFITTEGYVIAVRDKEFTMLRYWGSERTHWLRDCFGEPEPLDAPALSGRINGDLGVSTIANDQRRTEDQRRLCHLLGRSTPNP
jgi:hypothetical protein